MTLKIGLTGGIGAGKTTVSRIFECIGIPVFYADAEAKRIISETSPLMNEIVSAFVSESFTVNTYNAPYIARKVFTDKKMLKTLNQMVHPYVHKAFTDWYDKHRVNVYVLEEAALLPESGAKEFFDHIIVVSSPSKLRLKRVMDRDNIPAEYVLNRMNSQLPEEEMIRQADSLIFNGENDLLIPQVIALHNKFISL